MKILLIDDDEELLYLLRDYLISNGIEVLTASSGKEGLEIIGRESLDLVVLDVMMPGMNGLDVLKSVTVNYSHLPVILLTARGDEIERVLGLELGADDYIVKPFSSRELLARLNVIIRRREKFRKMPDATVGTAPLKLDLTKRHAFLEGEILKLTSIEFDILHILMEHRGEVMSREKIMELTRGKELCALDRSIDIQISRLRQKLEKHPENPTLIKTIWGVGYIYTGDFA